MEFFKMFTPVEMKKTDEVIQSVAEFREEEARLSDEAKTQGEKHLALAFSLMTEVSLSEKGEVQRMDALAGRLRSLEN